MPNMKEIRDIARQLGIRSTRMEKAELIRAIQRAEGNFDCFGTATEEECDQEECLWRDDCFRDSVAEETPLKGSTTNPRRRSRWRSVTISSGPMGWNPTTRCAGRPWI